MSEATELWLWYGEPANGDPGWSVGYHSEVLDFRDNVEDRDGEIEDYIEAPFPRIQSCVNACTGIADPSKIPELIAACERAVEDKHGCYVTEAIEAIELVLAALRNDGGTDGR